jgi:MFS family permease
MNKPATQARSFSPAYAWYVLILLTAGNGVSYLDRYLPSLVLEPIKRDLQLTDFQLGLMLGPAFVFFYLILGIPIGWLADRASRRFILATGITVWCCMTAMGGFAKGFGLLLASRLGVGLGEATLAPCALSLVSDYFPGHGRARAMSVLTSGTFMGAGIAFLLGGPLVHFIESLPPLVLPGFGALQSWRLCFIFVGLPGLILALSMITVREPPRHKAIAINPAGGLSELPGFIDIAKYIGRRWRAFGTLFIASGCNVTMGSLALWNIALFHRVWGWDVSEIGITVGGVLLAGGTIGTLIGIRLTRRAYARGREDAILWTLWIGLLIDIPAFTAYALMPNAYLGGACLFVADIGQAIATAAGLGALSVLAPGQIRSRITALYYLIISIASQLLGPPIVGWLADLFHDPKGLRYAISIEAIAVGLPASILVALGMKYFRREIIDMEANTVTRIS